MGCNSLSQTGLENRSDVVGAAQRNDAAAATDAWFGSIVVAPFRRFLVIFDHIADFDHCKLAGGDIRQIGRLGWLALPTGQQKFVELAGVRKAAYIRWPTDLGELAQNQLLVGAKDF